MTGEEALKELLIRIDRNTNIKDSHPAFHAGINIVKLLIDRLLSDIKKEDKKNKKNNGRRFRNRLDEQHRQHLVGL
jgi:hypothetical protein